MTVVPFAPSFPSDELDAAWVFALNEAVGHGLVFGRDVIFTYGPYAALYTWNYDPATDALAMFSGILLAIGLAAGLIALSPGVARWRAVLLALLLGLPQLRDPLFLVTPLVFLAVVARFVTAGGRARPPLAGAAVLLIMAMGVLPLVKGTFGAAAIVALGAASILLLRRHWRLAIAAACLFLASVSAFWCLAGQSLTNLPRYFAAQHDIIGGYTEAMCIAGPGWQVAVFAAAAAAILGANANRSIRSGVPGIAVWLVAVILLFLSFKSGFIRQDEHVGIGAGALGLVACTLAVFIPGRRSLFGLFAALIGWMALDAGGAALAPAGAVHREVYFYRRVAAGALARLQGGTRLQQDFTNALGQIRADRKLPDLKGSTDAYTGAQSIPLAYRLAWSPRPIPQSYSAYSPILLEDNARHLLAPSAPRNVIFALEPIDNHLPALEDGLSWPTLLTRYQPIWLENNLAVLRRSDAEAPPSSIVEYGTWVGRHLGEEVPLPPESETPLWAEIDEQPTVLGRALAVLYKPPPLTMSVRLASGSIYRFRYVAGMGRTGFVISPLIGNAAEFVALRTPFTGLFGNRAVAFTLAGDPRFWKSGYSLRLSRLHVPLSDAATAILFQKPAPAATGGDRNAMCYLDQINGQTVDHRAPQLLLSGPLQFSGWGFGGTTSGIEPQTVGVSLTAANGGSVGIPAVIGSRPDVGIAFHQPNLSRIGFSALMDLSGLSGRFSMALEMQSHGRHWSCPLFDSVSVTAAQKHQ